MPADREAQQFTPRVLREYALLADGERGALIGPRGEVTWMCAPHWDSDAVFASLIGGSGVYAVTPVDPRFVWGGRYEDRTLIWRSRWITSTGIVECREALAFPGDPGRLVLLRRIIAVDGTAHVNVRLDARAGYGRHAIDDCRRHGATWTGRVGDLRLRWSGGERARRGRAAADRNALLMELAVPVGSHHDLVLELSSTALPHGLPDPDRAWQATECAWRDGVPAFADTLAPRDTRHAYAVLRGLTSSGGGMVAATTMSLPERAEEGRNYDYRYVWIRDQCFAGEAVAAADAYPLLDAAVGFVVARLMADGPNLTPAYTTRGGPIPGQRRLRLPGYPGGFDITGNHVNRQFQLDAFGESLLLLAAAARHGHLDADGWRAVQVAARAISARWREPEAGIWELDARRWTHSRLICVAGLRAVSGAPGCPAPRSRRWLALADAILARTAARCVHASGRWQRAPDDPRVDAALLLAGVRGAVPAGDPRTRATLAAVRAELEQDGYIYRFRHAPGPLGDAEGAFLLCGFVAAMAAHQQGDAVQAIRYFERNRAACGPPGLYCEEYDVAQRQLRGNLPQAFVHALMLEASVRLCGPWRADR